jgi:hypothetical protein
MLLHWCHDIAAETGQIRLDKRISSSVISFRNNFWKHAHKCRADIRYQYIPNIEAINVNTKTSKKPVKSNKEIP